MVRATKLVLFLRIQRSFQIAFACAFFSSQRESMGHGAGAEARGGCCSGQGAASEIAKLNKNVTQCLAGCLPSFSLSLLVYFVCLLPQRFLLSIFLLPSNSLQTFWRI